MDEREVINKANALGIRALSKNNIKEGWEKCINLRNRIEDFSIFTSEYGIIDNSERKEINDLGSRLNEIAEKARLELIRRRDAKEFVTYR